MEKVSAHVQLKSTAQSFEQSNHLSSLFQLLSIKDPDVAQHSHRVHEWVRDWLEFLNQDPVQADDSAVKTVRSIQVEIELAALLHDIGKLGVLSEILNKKQALSEDEWRMMKLHVDLGYQMLERLPGFDLIAALIRQHHERFDGRGYPLGLEGSQITPGAQLISIVDAFDAMTSKRCYQKQRSTSEALEELKNEAGRQFDPYWVKSFIRFTQQSFEFRADLKV